MPIHKDIRPMNDLKIVLKHSKNKIQGVKRSVNKFNVLDRARMEDWIENVTWDRFKFKTVY